ncbi:MAG: alkaline phosphatase D family protein [Ignavibacteriales bacterium]
MREVALLVQTTKPASVKIAYWEKRNNKVKYFTDEVKTEKQKAFTAHLIADEVEPGRKYEYELYINNKLVKRNYPLEFQTQELWQWRKDAPDFSFITGSGAYINEDIYDRPGKPYGGEYEIYTSMYNQKPDFMIWLGDNVYLREADYYSRTGIMKRYTYQWSQPILQPLWGSIHHYAIWDDHDFGPNNSNRSFILKNETLDAFKLFWNNPSYGINNKPGTTSYFEWADCEFYLIDNRYYRSPETRENCKRQILGDEQVEWLIDQLTYSKAPFKFVVMGGQFLSTSPYSENYSNYADEQKKILDELSKEKISGVIFITGDRHFTELSKLEREGSYPLYDFTISPFTSGHYNGEAEPNSRRVAGTFVAKRNFAKFKVEGKNNERVLTCTVYDKDGGELWTYKIHENELKQIDKN